MPGKDAEAEAEAEGKHGAADDAEGKDGEAGAAAAAAAAAGDEIVSGFMLKKGVLGWQRRFFVLTAEAELRFYSATTEDRRDAKLKGTLPLTGSSRLRQSDARQYAFDVICGGKALAVAAETQASYDLWNEKIAATIARLRAEGSSAVDGSGAAGGADAAGAAEERFLVQEIMGSTFHVEPRYSDLRPIGQGAYGMVVQAHDSQDGKKVAIKKSKEVFNNVHDAKRVVREIRLLRVMQHPNIIQLKDMFIPNARGKFTDIYLVLELMDTNLHRVIYSPQDLSEDHKKFVLFQILCGLKFLHSAGVVHRDLKPSNVLINADCKVKICDFGLSREVEPEDAAANAGENGGEAPPDAQMTEYVITRWYRAPEVMLVSGHYGTAVDMWSVGCIYAEMCRRKALFKGRDYVDQLTRIFRVIGKPTEDSIAFVKKRRAREFILNLPHTDRMNIPDVCRPRNVPWEQAKHLPVDADGMDMLERILVLDPGQRLTVQQILDHPYMVELKDEEPVIPELEGVDLSTLVDMSDIETMELTRTNLRRASVKEMDLIHNGWIGHKCREMAAASAAAEQRGDNADRNSEADSKGNPSSTPTASSHK